MVRIDNVRKNTIILPMDHLVKPVMNVRYSPRYNCNENPTQGLAYNGHKKNSNMESDLVLVRKGGKVYSLCLCMDSQYTRTGDFNHIAGYAGRAKRRVLNPYPATSGN